MRRKCPAQTSQGPKGRHNIYSRTPESSL